MAKKYPTWFFFSFCKQTKGTPAEWTYTEGTYTSEEVALAEAARRYPTWAAMAFDFAAPSESTLSRVKAFCVEHGATTLEADAIVQDLVRGLTAAVQNPVVTGRPRP